MRCLAILASLATLSGCGGQIIASAEDGSAVPVTSVAPPSSSEDGGTGTGTGSSSNPFPECPGQQPKAGYACTTPNQGCAYVDITTKACQSWTCGSNHEWYSSTPAGC
jgi:hypothetical protein